MATVQSVAPAAHEVRACRTLGAALREALPKKAIAPAVAHEGWACARGKVMSGGVLEVRLGGGGLLEVVIDGVLVDTNLP